jgi:N-methylhydantoinase B/oxoprolinase/acetone carboxylase alpha subunit
VETHLDGKVAIEVRAGDRLIVETPGGGGWGVQGTGVKGSA